MEPAAGMEHQSLARLASRLPGAVGMFRRCGLSLPVMGNMSLDAAVAAAGLPRASVLGALEDLLWEAGQNAPDNAVALMDYIEDRYHRSLRSRLAQLVALGKRAEEAALLDILTGDELPRGIAALLRKMETEALDHARHQESRIFPLLRAGAFAEAHHAHLATASGAEAHDASVLAIEHATAGLTLPPQCPPAWQHLYAEIEWLVDETVTHFYLEHCVLFPRLTLGTAAAAETCFGGGRCSR